MKPIRIQRKRIKGWKMPKNTICITRGTLFGNPFVAGMNVFINNNEDAVKCYERWINEQKPIYNHLTDKIVKPPTFEQIKALKGKNLACFCKEDEKFCHADFLIKIANS